jgi:hypothetical protein
MLKFDFSIQTRNAQKIEGIVIMGRDQDDAERKLRQMYRHCEVLRCRVKQADEAATGGISVCNARLHALDEARGRR